MAIEGWIDAVVAVAGSVESHVKGRKVRAYKLAGKAEVPETLGEYPCAVVYPERVRVDLAVNKEIYEGVMVFYLFADTKKTNLPELMRYFSRILAVLMVEANWTLGGLVDHFHMTEDGIEFILADYGDEVSRHALQLRWEVKASL